MTYIDGLPPLFRALVHEFGFNIVYEMIEDGYRDPFELRGLLENWRERRQMELLP